MVKVQIWKYIFVLNFQKTVWNQFGDFIDLGPAPHSSNYVDPEPHKINAFRVFSKQIYVNVLSMFFFF